MSEPHWDDRYRAGETPWDTGIPEPLLVEAARHGLLPPGRLLEIGCGTGTNAHFLARHGWQVTGLDLSPTAIAQAQQGDSGARFAVHDLLAEPLPGGPYDAVFDRGCFHVFERAEDRSTFAARVAGVLRTGGCWLSLIGSTEGPPRQMGPPRRTAGEVIEAIEPFLAITELRLVHFAQAPGVPTAWFCLACARDEPASPSTRR